MVLPSKVLFSLLRSGLWLSVYSQVAYDEHELEQKRKELPREFHVLAHSEALWEIGVHQLDEQLEGSRAVVESDLGLEEEHDQNQA